MNAFYFGEEQKKFSAFVGSPTAGEVHEEYDTNYSSAKENSFHLGVTSKGKETKVVVIAGSVHGQAEAEAAYHRLESNYAALLKESADYYRAYLDSTVSVELPDRQLQQSYDWARVSVLQGLVTNPYLGTGLDRRVSHLGRQPASGLRLVFRPRFAMDCTGARCRGRLWHYPHRAGFSEQVSARRRQGPARNFPGRKLRSLVHRLSLPLCFRRCDAAVHHRHERLRGGERRRGLRPAEVGQPVEGLSISAFHLRCAGAAAEFRHRSRLGGRRPAASGPY